MWETLVLIAWGTRSNPLNQAFTILLGLTLLSQLIRYWKFQSKLSQWIRVFVEAKISFEREGAVQIKGNMDELHPPQAAFSQLWFNVPPLLIMLGLLGTFIGLTLALAVIPFGGTPDAIQDGVKQALPSMGSAFWTSLSALACSLMIRITSMLMESAFKNNVLLFIAKAEPALIQHIEKEAFKRNQPGAFLRPHSLREVMWQQNLEFNKHLQRLGSEISSSIRELPHFIGGNKSRFTRSMRSIPSEHHEGDTSTNNTNNISTSQSANPTDSHAKNLKKSKSHSTPLHIPSHRNTDQFFAMKSDSSANHDEPLLDTLAPQNIEADELELLDDDLYSHLPYDHLTVIWDDHLKEQKRIRVLLQDLVNLQKQTLLFMQQNSSHPPSVPPTPPPASRVPIAPPIGETIETHAMSSFDE